MEANSGSTKCRTNILVPALNVLSTSLPILKASFGIFRPLASHVEEKVYHYLKILVRRFLLPVLGLRDFLIELVLQRFV